MGKYEKPRSGGKIGKYIATVLLCLLLLLAFLGFFAARWYVAVYGRIGFDSVLYTLTASLGGLQSDLIISFLKGGALPAVLCWAVVCAVLFLPWKKLGVKLRFFPLRRWIASLLAVTLSLGLLIHAAFNVELVDYIYHMVNKSELYNDEYRDPNAVEITFPEEKRNLIYIMLESMETSYMGKDDGGALPQSLIPELEQLAKDNINFSHNTNVGGFREVSGASWTIGAMVSLTSGVPLKVPDGIDDWQNGYGKDGVFLPGLTSISTILAENGYNQALMVGSDAKFGGRKTYYSTHGVDNIYDIYTAWKDDVVPNGYFEWWGMEDLYLFDYAKEKITEMAAGEEPFAFTMLTVDTHHIGGYKCVLCGSDHEENYENVISCSSRQVAAFVQWIQQQDFYENTTVIITGDHCSMDRGYFNRNVDPNYTRHVYNCFINSAVEPARTTNRQFCAIDMFPSTLAAIGCTIEDDRLGLGVNLFSAQPTLMERMGYDQFYSELAKKSDYYSEHFYTAQ
ncbi:MAG: LTA synthase family protein [Oscillospiraceae bacterium]|nr:LTA synthase family protein [Oscillospiraceae bacterium]